jgi:pilus assembly protein Flp/PilA
MARNLLYKGRPRLRLGKSTYGENRYEHYALKLYVKFQDLMSREEGQDLVEYALVVALIAFGAITGMGYLAKGLNNAFATISTTLATNL